MWGDQIGSYHLELRRTSTSLYGEIGREDHPASLPYGMNPAKLMLMIETAQPSKRVQTLPLRATIRLLRHNSRY